MPLGEVGGCAEHLLVKEGVVRLQEGEDVWGGSGGRHIGEYLRFLCRVEALLSDLA